MPVSITEENLIAPQTPPPERHRRSRSLGWLIALAALAAAAALVYFVAWLPRQREREAIDKEAQQRTTVLPRVPVVKVKRAPAASELLVPGTTLPYAEAYLYARASGYLSKRLVDIGDRVTKGQLLATIDSPDLDRQVAQGRSTLAQSEAALAQVEAQQQLAELTWNRWKVLVAKGVFSRQEGDQQEANYRVAVSNVNAAKSSIEANRENLNRLVVLQEFERVTAPFSGVITARNVDVGALIGSGGSGMGASAAGSLPGLISAAVQGNNQGASGSVNSQVSPSTGGAQGGQMFSIASTDRLRVLVSVPEAYTSAIKTGQAAELSFQERSSAKIHGRVTRTSASIDQNTRTLLVEVQMANNGRLVPGMYTTVNFISVKAEPSLLIPGAAIVVRGGRTTVAAVSGNTVRMKPITIGRDYGDETEVTGGLEEGDTVATDVTDQVQEGVKIEPQYQAEKAQQPVKEQGSSQSTYGNQRLTDQAQKAPQAGGKGKSNSSSGQGQSSSKQ